MQLWWLTVHRLLLPLQIGDQLLYPLLGEDIKSLIKKLSIVQNLLLEILTVLT
jgi:hypothetical protein